MPIRPRPTRKAIRSPRRGAHAHLLVAVQGLARLDADHPRALAHRARVRGLRPAPVLRAMPALRDMQWLSSSGCAGTRVSRRPLTIPVRPATAGSRSTIRQRCSRPASGAPTAEAQDPGTIGFHLSALYSPVGWFSWAHIARLWEARRAPTRPSAASRTPCSARPGSRPARRRIGSGSTSAARLGRRHRPERRAVPHRRRRRPEGPHRSRRLGSGVEGSRAGSSITSSSMADPSMPRPGSELGVLLDRTWPHARRHADRPRQARHRHRLRGARRLCLGSPLGHAQVAPIKGVEGFNRSAPVSGPTHVDVTEGGKKLRRGAGFGPSPSRPSRARPIACCACQRHRRGIAAAPAAPPATSPAAAPTDGEAARRRAARHR